MSEWTVLLSDGTEVQVRGRQHSQDEIWLKFYDGSETVAMFPTARVIAVYRKT